MYSGAAPGAGRVPVMPMPRDVMSAEWQRGAMQAAENAGQLIPAMVQMSDEETALRGELEMQKVRAEMMQEATRRQQLPDGDAEAFYQEDGGLNQRGLSEFIQPYAERMRTIGKGMINPSARQAIQAKAAAAWQGMEADLQMMGLRSSLQRRSQLMEDNYRLAMDSGNYDAAAQYAVLGAQNGFWTEPEGELRAFRARRGAVADGITAAIADDPGSAFDILNSDDARVLSPQERMAFDRQIRSAARVREQEQLERFLGGAMPSDVRRELEQIAGKGGKGGSGKSGKQEEPGFEYSGLLTLDQLRWAKAMRAGQNVTPQVRAGAVQEAMALSPALMDDPEAMERRRAEFEQLYSAFGMDDSDITRIWNQGVKNLERVRSGDLDVATRVQAALDAGMLLPDAKWQQFQSHFQNGDGEMDYSAFETDRWARQQYGALAGIKDGDSAEEAYQKAAVHQQKALMKEAQNSILSRYSQWRDSENGEKATTLEQLDMLQSISREVLGHDVRFDNAIDMSKAWDQANKAEHFENQRKYRAPQKAEHVEVPEKPLWSNVTLSFDSSKKDLPAGVLVPKSWMTGKDSKKLVYDVVFDNKHFRRFRVVGTTEGSSPVMTYAVARDGGRQLNSRYEIVGRLREGDTDALMDDVETTRYGGGNYVTGDYAGAMNTAQVPAGLRPYIQDFIEAGEEYGVNPTLLMAISMHETANGTSSAFRNKRNAMGISDSRGVRAMASVRESIFHMARQLAERSYYRGKSIGEIASSYAPVGAENDPRGLNGYWAKGVQDNIKKLNS